VQTSASQFVHITTAKKHVLYCKQLFIFYLYSANNNATIRYLAE